MRDGPLVRWEDYRAALPPALARARRWAREHLLRRPCQWLAELGQALTAHRVRSALAALLLAGAGLVALRILPAVYGRYALAHAAGNAARQIRLKGEDRVLWELRGQAFDLGLVEVAMDPDGFLIETGYQEDLPVCTVSYAFTHVVPILGALRLPMRIQAKVTRAVVEPAPLEAPASPDVPAGPPTSWD